MDHLRDRNNTPDIHHFRARLVVTLRPSDDAERPNYHAFPERCGFRVKETGRILEINVTDKTLDLSFVNSRDDDPFIQRWLYFEVLREIFFEVFAEQGKHFTMSSFVRNAGGTQWITTEMLPKYIEYWKAFEIEQRKNKAPGQTMRMIRIQQVLDQARRFVYSFLSVSNGKSEPVLSQIDPHVTLAIMVLGETLARANSRIREAIEFQIHGWQNNTTNGQGWGYSKLILDELKPPLWCKRKVRMLSALFQDNVVGLLFAIKDKMKLEPSHVACTDTQCTLPEIHKFDQNYPLAHSPDGKCLTSSCEPIGPKPEKLIAALTNGHVPLLRFQKTPSGEPELEVVPMIDWNQEYAIFSHVWSDGFGNPNSNKMNSCLFGYFTSLFQDISNDLAGPGQNHPSTSAPELFWIDTLAMPIKKHHPNESRQAVRKMHDIYAHAKYTIVLDRGLTAQLVDPGYASTAMKITMCGWMTRIWTLQEAALSRNIYFSLNDGLCSLDQLESRFEREDMQIRTCIPEISRAYYHGILGTERHRLTDPDMKHQRQKTTPEFVARVWSAAQWRTTTYLQHETLALATLLNLDTDPFADADQTGKNFKNLDENDPDYERKRKEILDKRMRKLFRQLSELSPCAIPAGMIFLPYADNHVSTTAGVRLSGRGYGWAPETWLSSQMVPSPNPLTLPASESFLDIGRGLQVRYPGFILHEMGSRKESLHKSEDFSFPIDSDLHEWYLAKTTDKDAPFPTSERLKKRTLAIIAMRLPTVLKQEIALLVSITKRSKRRLDVEIENRILLTRETGENTLSIWRNNFRQNTPDIFSCGEQLPDTQLWCVDGPQQPMSAHEKRIYIGSASAGSSVSNITVFADARTEVTREPERTREPEVTSEPGKQDEQPGGNTSRAYPRTAGERPKENLFKAIRRMTMGS